MRRGRKVSSYSKVGREKKSLVKILDGALDRGPKTGWSPGPVPRGTGATCDPFGFLLLIKMWVFLFKRERSGQLQVVNSGWHLASVPGASGSGEAMANCTVGAWTPGTTATCHWLVIRTQHWHTWFFKGIWTSRFLHALSRLLNVSSKKVKTF